MRKSVKFLIGIIGATLCVLFVCIVIGKNNIPDYREILDMDYDKSYARNKDDIREYFQEFNDGVTINMYEYADNPSIQDTLMYYYFSDDMAVEKYYGVEKILIEQLKSYELTDEELENNISEIVDVLYLLSYCNTKYSSLESQNTKILEEIIVKINAFIVSRGDECVEMFMYKWKLMKLAKSIRMSEDGFANWNSYEDKIIKHEEEKYVLEIIHTLFENNDDKAKELYNRYTKFYRDGDIDIETYIVYIGLLSDVYTPDKEVIAEEDIYDYCMHNFYFISPMVRFLGFKVVISNDEYKDNVIVQYTKMHTNEDGMVSTTCIIMPTYRRLYSYIQICETVGIDLKQEAIGNWVNQIEVEQIRVEDLFYMWLIFEAYPEFKIELKTELNELSRSAAKVKIGQTNSFNVYSILKALACEDVAADDLYDNYMQYFKDNESSTNALEHLWKMELELLYEHKQPNVDKIYSDLKSVPTELKIDYFYYALNILLILENDIDEEVAEYMLSEVSTYRTYGGYYANKDFKYVDIYRTYQCMFIENKIERNNVQ